MLLPGDPVVVVGSAEMVGGTSGDGVGSARLVVRPRRGARRGLVQHAVWLSGLVAQEDEDIFYLHTTGENAALRKLRSAARWSAGVAAAWLVASLWLASARSDGFSALPEGWLSAERVARNRAREHERLAAVVSRVGPESRASIPELEALLRSRDTSEQWLALQALLRLPPAEVLEVEGALPALIEAARAPEGKVHFQRHNELVDVMYRLGEVDARRATATPAARRADR